MTRQRFPQSFVTVTTNAQGKVKDEAVTAGLDEIVCSIDGMDQDSYEVYRVGGSFELAYRFMADFAAGSHEAVKPIRVVWKYVLFDHNSEPEQLLQVQRLARQAGVDEIVFVFTRNGPRSETILHPSQIPLLPAPAGGVAVRSTFHQPETADLEVRLKEAQKLMEKGEQLRAVDLIASIGENIARFFPDAKSLEPRHRSLASELLKLSSELGPHVRRRTESRLVSLGIGKE